MGLWMGGVTPLSNGVKDCKLVVVGKRVEKEKGRLDPPPERERGAERGRSRDDDNGLNRNPRSRTGAGAKTPTTPLAQQTHVTC